MFTSNQIYEFLRNGEVSLRELPESDDTVRLLPLLLDPDRVDTLDLEDRPDSDPEPDPDPDPDLDPAEVLSVFEDRPDFVVRLELDVRPDFEEMPETSERSDLDDNSETEDTLVLEVIPDTVDRAVVDLFCSGSGCAWIVMTLEEHAFDFKQHQQFCIFPHLTLSLD